MQFSTPIEIQAPAWQIEPCSRLLFAGSCFADSIGRKFSEMHFTTEVNPYGTMYNPASVCHTVARASFVADIVFITLGTNRIYRLRETGEIVDNCEKRPQNLFREEELSVAQCLDWLEQTRVLLLKSNPGVRTVVTVSPIRYAKYGFHGSQLSKAVLLLAAESFVKGHPEDCWYFPAYEIVMDELRDYRFYAPDMIHPSPQAVDYIWERLGDTLFSPQTHRCLSELRPILAALNHRFFDPDAPAAIAFREETERRLAEFIAKWRQ